MKIPAHLLVPLLRTPATTSLTIERRETAPAVDGLGQLTPATPTLLTADFVVHQATRQQLERAQLDYGPDWRAFYSTTELRTTAAAGSSGPADVVQYNGERWTLHDAGDYSDLGGLYLALGRREE